VGIVYRWLPDYRVEFFSRLRDVLSGDNIELGLVYGSEYARASESKPPLPWAAAIKNRAFSAMGRQLVWQRIPRSIGNADLVVLAQENLMLSNYLLFARGVLSTARVAFWGHGINRQQRVGSLANRVKLWYSCRAHWWFAYSQGGAELMSGRGFPHERITVVQNAFDTRALAQERECVEREPIVTLRGRLGLGSGPVGIYCGQLNHQKRVDFLLESCRQIRERLADFELVVIGEGPESNMVRRFAEHRVWVHYVGPRRDMSRVPYFCAADVSLMPGAVGLGVLDSFALRVPMVTTELPGHGPEIEYLNSGENGLVTSNSQQAFVDGVVRVLLEPEIAGRLRAGCAASERRYTLETMVANFRDGVHRALVAPKRGRSLSALANPSRAVWR
jgi:glycosyltransferase involved in cell wall biosynthesis